MKDKEHPGDETAAQKPEYPKGFDHVRQAVEQTKGRVAEWQEQMRNLPEDRYIAPRPRSGSEIPFQYTRSPKTVEAQRLNERIEKAKQKTLGSVDKMLAKATPEQRKQVRAAVLEDLYPNPTRNMNAGEKDKLAGEKKRRSWLRITWTPRYKT